jgi:hypothetical protein
MTCLARVLWHGWCLAFPIFRSLLSLHRFRKGDVKINATRTPAGGEALSQINAELLRRGEPPHGE